MKAMPKQSRIVGALIILAAVLLLVGSLVHWLIILGVLKEHAPLPITLYFHSLAVINPICAIGLFKRKRWGRLMAIGVGLTQLPAHGYMIYLDNFAGWISGLSLSERLIDMVLCIILIAAFSSTPFERAFADDTSEIR